MTETAPLSIDSFIEKWFKHGVHRDGIEQYFRVYGRSIKNLGRYIQINFGDTKTNNGHFFEKMKLKEMDNYMEDLLELMS